MNRWTELKNSLNLANRSYCTYDGIVFLIRQQTWTTQEFFLLINLGEGGGGGLLWRNHCEIEMKLGIYVPINVGNLMSIGNDRQ